MFDVGDILREGFDEARSRLRSAQRTLARANSGIAAGRSVDNAMAETAQAALFTEALLSAEHARFAEIKAVLK